MDNIKIYRHKNILITKGWINKKCRFYYLILLFAFYLLGLVLSNFIEGEIRWRSLFFTYIMKINIIFIYFLYVTGKTNLAFWKESIEVNEKTKILFLSLHQYRGELSFDRVKEISYYKGIQIPFNNYYSVVIEDMDGVFYYFAYALSKEYTERVIKILNHAITGGSE